MAMACFLVLTRLPLFPLFKLPSFSLCIARLTDRCALLPYMAISYSFLSIDLIAKPQGFLPIEEVKQVSTLKHELTDWAGEIYTEGAYNKYSCVLSVGELGVALEVKNFRGQKMMDFWSGMSIDL